MTCNTGIVTGTILSASTAADPEVRATGLLFDDQTTGSPAHSPNIEVGVDGCGMVLRAFDLRAGDQIKLQQVIGEGQGAQFVDVKVAGVTPTMDADNNLKVLVLPGRYRLVYTGGNSGLFRVSAQRIPPSTLPIVGAFVIG